MKFYFFIFLVFTISLCKAKHNVRIYPEKTDSGITIYADNHEFCHMSIKIDFNNVNLNIDGTNNKIYVIDAKKKRQLLVKLSISKNAKTYKLSYKSKAIYGNYNLKEYDIDYKYNLPYEKSNIFRVSQGYNGKSSHQNKNALDFSMPIGTKITSIRDGIVIKVVEENSKNCAREKCKKFNNSILIYHPDGTFAIYSHIKKNGAIVDIGDKVTKGQVIGYSGNVGFSSGPHLHLSVFKQNFKKRQTLKTKFKIGNGDDAEYLIEKNKYIRNY